MIHEVAVANVLIMGDEVESNIKGLTLEDRLAFTQAAHQNIHARQLSSNVKLVHLATTGKSISIQVTDSLTFSQVAIPRAFEMEIQQTFFAWSDILNDPFAPLVRHQLGLSQLVTVYVAKAAYDVLPLVDTVTLSIDRNLTIEQTMTLGDAAVVFIPSKYWSAYEIEVIEP